MKVNLDRKMTRKQAKAEIEKMVTFLHNSAMDIIYESANNPDTDEEQWDYNNFNLNSLIGKYGINIF